MSVRCDWMMLLVSGASQCAYDATDEVGGSVFCESHAVRARQAVLDDEDYKAGRDLEMYEGSHE